MMSEKKALMKVRKKNGALAATGGIYIDLDKRYWEDVEDISDDEGPALPSSADRGAEGGDEPLTLLPFDTLHCGHR